jgi:hypothetical protein
LAGVAKFVAWIREVPCFGYFARYC